MPAPRIFPSSYIAITHQPLFFFISNCLSLLRSISPKLSYSSLIFHRPSAHDTFPALHFFFSPFTVHQSRRIQWRSFLFRYPFLVRLSSALAHVFVRFVRHADFAEGWYQATVLVKAAVLVVGDPHFGNTVRQMVGHSSNSSSWSRRQSFSTPQLF